MKNKLNIILSVLILTTLVLSCSFYDSAKGGNSTSDSNSANKTLTDKVVDSTIGEEKIGIKECDEVVEFFARQYASPDDGFVTKTAKQYALNTIRDNFKKSLEQNKNDRAKLAKDCRAFKAQLDSYDAEESNSNK